MRKDFAFPKNGRKKSAHEPSALTLVDDSAKSDGALDGDTLFAPSGSLSNEEESEKNFDNGETNAGIDKTFNHRTRFQSDIVIVRVNENDYYVSEKIQGRDVYHKLLKDRSSKSTHYPTIEIARRVAEEKRQCILQYSPDCQIIELNADDYQSNAKMATNVEKYIYDNHGNVLFGYDAKNKIVVTYRPEDTDYKYINIFKYSNIILTLKNNIESTNLDFYTFGLERGFDIALVTSLPYIYIEIYKAEELIKSFECDVELYKFDIEYYKGYLNALKTSIEVQKQCKNDIFYFLKYWLPILEAFLNLLKKLNSMKLIRILNLIYFFVILKMNF